MDDLWKVSACTKTFSYQNVLLTFMKWIFFPPWPSEDWTCELQILQVMLIHYVVSSNWVGGVWFQIDCRRNGWQNWRRFFLSPLLAVCEAILSWSRTQKHTSLMWEVNLGEISCLRTSKLDFKYYTSFTPWLITEFFKMLWVPYL